MKILLVDDHPLVRKGLSHVLSLENDMEIVGEAGNTNEAVLLQRKSRILKMRKRPE